MEELIALQGKGYWYLATPYTKWECGLNSAFEHACNIAAELLKNGINIYSPIVHGHLLSTYGDINPIDHDIWMKIDAPMVYSSVGMIVVKMPGWDESKGIKHEIIEFKNSHKPIKYLEWPILIE